MDTLLCAHAHSTKTGVFIDTGINMDTLIHTCAQTGRDPQHVPRMTHIHRCIKKKKHDTGLQENLLHTLA